MHYFIVAFFDWRQATEKTTDLQPVNCETKVSILKSEYFAVFLLWPIFRYEKRRKDKEKEEQKQSFLLCITFLGEFRAKGYQCQMPVRAIRKAREAPQNSPVGPSAELNPVMAGHPAQTKAQPSTL